jgi:hypothetical protein
MSVENDDLFEGLQIMSPSELNSAVAATNEGTPTEVNEEFTLEPVRSESGDSETTKETREATPRTNDTNESQSDVVYKALIKELVKGGVITAEEAELDELPGSFDTIKDLLAKTIDKTVEEKQEGWKKGLSPAKKRFLEIEDAFDETDQAILMAQRLEFFENTSVEQVKENVDLQKQIYYEQLVAKNFSHEDAIEAIDDALAVNKLEEKALKAIPELKSQSEAIVREAKDAKETKSKAELEAQTKAFESLLSNVDSRDAFIDGLTLNKVAKDKLKANIINPVHTDPKTGKEYNSLMYKQHRNPAEFEMLINYYDTLGLFNIDKEGKFKPDITKIKAVAKTAAINELDKVIATEEQRGVGRNTSMETSKKTEGILSMLERAISNK